MSNIFHSVEPSQGNPGSGHLTGVQPAATPASSVARLRSRLACLRRDRRGATAVLFGVSAVVVVGMVGLGTEGGSWYVVQRDAQNAADTAAYAGAVRLSLAQSALGQTLSNGQTQARDTAADTATRNGFTTGASSTTVTTNTPPTSGSQNGNIAAVQVVITRNRPRLISNLFLTGTQAITVRGVAATVSNGSACLLAIPGFGTGTVTGQLLAGGSSTVTAASCILASNATISSAIEITGSSTVTALSLTSSGGCSGCASATVTNPIKTYAPPSTNPLAYLNSKVLPTFNNGNCDRSVFTAAGVAMNIPNNGGVNSSIVIPVPAAGDAICGLDISGAGTVVTFNPGTYYFYNSSFRVTSGTVQCRMPTTPPTSNGAPCTGGYGVTFVFTGSPGQIGGPNINGNAVITLSAPSAAHASDPDYAGILFFRDPRATGGNGQGNPAVDINGGANTSLTGGMYFPNSYVKYSGNSAVNSCSVLIGGTVEMTGNSGLTIDQCAALGFGNLAPQIQIVRLVE